MSIRQKHTEKITLIWQNDQLMNFFWENLLQKSFYVDNIFR